MTVSMVVAADQTDAIGRDGTLPWHLPDDLKRFRRLTTGHTVVVGRRTQDDIVRRLGRPLPDRLTIVVTRGRFQDSDTVHYRHSVDEALRDATGEVFVIGGAEIYRAALPRVERVHLTRVVGDHDGDTRLDAGWLDGFTLVGQEPATPQYQWLTYERT